MSGKNFSDYFATVYRQMIAALTPSPEEAYTRAAELHDLIEPSSELRAMIMKGNTKVAPSHLIAASRSAFRSDLAGAAYNANLDQAIDYFGVEAVERAAAFGAQLFYIVDFAKAEAAASKEEKDGNRG